jgi:hypothetical protein
VGPDLFGGRPRPIALWSSASSSDAGKTVANAKIGDVRKWLGVDDDQGILYVKKYELRGRGKHSEVWVASGRSPLCDGLPQTACPTNEDAIVTGTEFPSGDCRNDGRTEVTDGQVNYLIDEFDNVMFPKETKFLSAITRKNGSKATLPASADLPKDYYVGPGKKVIVLVDNVRDDNFYDTNNTSNLPYIAGFFSSQFDDGLFDRNVMTIDAYDWIHRTGSNPPDGGVPGDLCKSLPARPFLYEGTFAHEYQHLLEHNRDPFELAWVDEGMADWAMFLTGYSLPQSPVTDRHLDSHIQCFLGNLGVQTTANPTPRSGGPENGLTWWADQGSSEILCDYGAAFSFMLDLSSRYGRTAITKLHGDPGAGFDGLGNVLDAVAPGETPRAFLDDWLVAMALDGVLDDGATLRGGDPADFQVKSLDATINWDVLDAYATPGAPPNGADFVRLRDGAGQYLNASQITDVAFDGTPTVTSGSDSRAVDGYTVRLVGYNDDHTEAFVVDIPLDANFDGSLSSEALRQAIGSTAQTVAAIVILDDSTEHLRGYAHYTLTVNGVVQPGG